ncbi:MAG: GNAT family N-acetyltransferase [Acidimicrobiales bacterium]
MESGPVDVIREADRQRAVSTLALAFAADPLVRWFWPDPHKYVMCWPRFVDTYAGRAFDHGSAHWLAGQAIALWLPPGDEGDDTPLVELMIESLHPQTLSDLGEMFVQMIELHPTTEHWYLPVTGVDPAAQGRGLGTTVLRHGLSLADRDGVPAYLEASSRRSRALYARLGFELVDEIQAGSSPPIWAMIRQPGAGGTLV